MNKISQLKDKISIVELASRFGAMPYGNGNVIHTKFNPLRVEKTSSLKLYVDTNSWNDFGGQGGSILDFVMEAEGISPSDAIQVLENMFGATDNEYVPKPVVVQEKKYLTSAQVENVFYKSPFHVDLDLKIHADKLYPQNGGFIPKYLLSEAAEIDKEYFFDNVRYCRSNETPIVLMRGADNKAYTFRYRYKKKYDDNIDKWVNLKGAKSSYLYCRLNENRFTLIVEGSRDFYTAILLGYSVIALPSANFKEIPQELLVDRLAVFIDDDDGKNFMSDLIEKTVCEKVVFNHAKFKEITKCNSKDLTDYAYQFDDFRTFRDTFERFVLEADVKKDDYFSTINEDNVLTYDDLFATAKVPALIEGFLYKGTANIIHSKPGQGKSTLVLAIINKLLREGTIKNVVYFDADNPKSVLKSRIEGLLKQHGKNLVYFSKSKMTLAQMHSEMDRMCLFRDSGTETLVVIDVLGRFIKEGGSINTDADVVPILDKINKLTDIFGCTSVIIHHSNKAETSEGRPVFQGSQKISGNLDSCWGLSRSGDTLTLFQDKSRFDEHDKVKVGINLADLTIESFVGSYLGDDEESEDTELPFTIEDVKRYVRDCGDWVMRSKIEGHFKVLRNDNHKKALRDMLFSNKDIFKYDKIGNGHAYLVEKSDEPVMTEFISEDEIEKSFGNLY